MTQLQYTAISSRFSKKTISKVTTAKSSRKYSITDDGFQKLVKSIHFETLYPVEPHKYLKTMRKNMFIFPKYHDFKQNLKNDKLHKFDRQIIETELWKFIELIYEKYNLSYQTRCLGLCFYIKYVLKKLINKDSYSSNPLYMKKFQISVCIFLAIKTIQQQKNIPKPASYQYFCGQNYTFADYNQFQRELLQVLQFQLQNTTVVTFLNFYLSIGIFYDNQIIEVNKDIQVLQHQIMQAAITSIKEWSLQKYKKSNPQKQAIGIIKKIRKKYYLTQQNRNLQLLWQQDLDFIRETKQSAYNLKSTRSMGSLFLNISRTNSLSTQKFNHQSDKANGKNNQSNQYNYNMQDLSVRNNSQRLTLNNKMGISGNNYVLKRKPDLNKTNKKKSTNDNKKLDQIQNMKYVTIKKYNDTNQQLLEMGKSLMRCKSASSSIGQLIKVAIKYQKDQDTTRIMKENQIKKNSNNSSIIDKSFYFNRKSQEYSKKVMQNQKNIIYFNSLAQCRSSQNLNKSSLKNINKKSKFIHINVDKIIERSRSKSSSNSRKSLNKKQNKQADLNLKNKYFHRKNYVNSEKQ